MAQQQVQLEEAKFCCSICGDLLKDPVTIPCGHSYCRNCIQSYWDEEDQRKVSSCPQCGQTFIPRPVLGKSTMLADLVEELKKTGLRAAPADPCYAGPEDVACDVCTGRKLKALKSCLVCLASYCERHLQPHYDAAPLKRHKLVEPCKKLEENICSAHGEVMKMFCRTDQQCICYLCSLEHHKGHDTVSAAAERTERQRELEGSRQQIQQRIQVREKEVKVLQQEEEAINQSADKAVEDSQETFTQMIRLIEDRSSEVQQQIRSQQETEVTRVQELQEKLEQEITELRSTDADLDQLSRTQDHIQFLQNYPSLPHLSGPTDSSSIKIRPWKDFEDVMTALSKVRDKLHKTLSDDWMIEDRSSEVQQQIRSQQETEVSRVQELQEKLEQEITELRSTDADLDQLSHTQDHPSLPHLKEPTDSSSINIRPRKDFEDMMTALPKVRDKRHKTLNDDWMNLTQIEREPRTRTEFLIYSRKITLDPNSANGHLVLSDGNRKAMRVSQKQIYSDHPDRFIQWSQVLSSESLTGRCYWEVKLSGDVYVAVTYENIKRTGGSEESGFGLNDKSWVLYYYKNSYYFRHNNIDTPVSGPRLSKLFGLLSRKVSDPWSFKIGVYLDHSAGILSFYSVSEPMTLLHRVQTTFTQPLHAGFRIYGFGSCVEICDLR